MYINWDRIKQLGKIPDVELSRQLNVTPQAVFLARKKRGIPAMHPSKQCNINWDLVPLGKMIDQHIADILGCSGAYVCKKRKQKNIPAFGMLYRTIENEAAYYEESIVDAWLHNHNIDHQFQYQIGPYRVDWHITKSKEIWEFLGMWNHRLYGKQYRDRFVIKEDYLKKQGYTVRRIYRQEMKTFRNGVDLTTIHNATNFICRGCNRETVKHQAKGLCGMCLNRLNQGQELGPPKISKMLKPGDIFVCEDCGNNDRNRRVRNKCKHCYAKARRQSTKKKHDPINMV